MNWQKILKANLLLIILIGLALLMHTISPLLVGILLIAAAWQYRRLEKKLRNLNFFRPAKFSQQHTRMEKRNRDTSRVFLAVMGIITSARAFASPYYRLRLWDISWQIGLTWLLATVLFCTVSLILKTWIEDQSETYEQYSLSVSRIYPTVYLVTYLAALWTSHRFM